VTDLVDDRTTRLVRWWTRLYTAGLHTVTAALRRAEIDSDLAEHERFRADAGWTSHRVARERLRRALAGAPADIAWRHDRLRGQTRHRSVVTLLGTATSLAQLVLAGYLFAFTAYLLGNSDLADQKVLGRYPLQGFEHYADAPGTPAAVAIIGALGVVLVISSVARPISPLLSNVAAIPIAMLTALFFWLGVWPLGLLILAGAGLDLAVRAQPSPTG
jgi:hypothetical protein